MPVEKPAQFIRQRLQGRLQRAAAEIDAPGHLVLPLQHRLALMGADPAALALIVQAIALLLRQIGAAV